MSPLRPTDKGYFLEFNEYFLLVARTRSLGPPLLIEDLREAPLDNKNAVTQVMNAVIPAASRSAAHAVCSLRPKGRFFHLAGEEEARQFATASDIEAFVRQGGYGVNGSNGFVTVQVDNGLLLNGHSNARWLLVGAPRDGLFAAKTMLDEWKIAPVRSEAAALSLLSAVTTGPARNGAPAPLFVWDIGENGSDLLLIGAKGLEAAVSIPFGFDKIAESVQAEISLKFKGAATKLFFNEYYDFSEVGVKIAARIAEALRPAMAGISRGGSANTAALLCTGLSSKQAWFTQCLALSLELVPWQPDLANWCRQAGLQFAGNTLQGSLSPSWIGLLEVIRAFKADDPDANNPWHPVWDNLAEMKSPSVTAAPSGAASRSVAGPAARPVAIAPTKVSKPILSQVGVSAASAKATRSVAKPGASPSSHTPSQGSVKPTTAKSAPTPIPSVPIPAVKAAVVATATVTPPPPPLPAPRPSLRPLPSLFQPPSLRLVRRPLHRRQPSPIRLPRPRRTRPKTPI